MIRLALVLIALALPARATVPASDLCLVLLQDTSSSLDNAELEQMRSGLAKALTDQRLASAFSASRVQVLVVSYGSASKVVLPWFIAGPDTLAGAASAILDMPRAAIGGTATGEAIAFALAELDAMPCTRKVIDVATDGETNAGRSPSMVTAEVDPFAVQINGLVIGDGLALFRETTQFGYGAFTVQAATYEDFGIAMLRKLSLEISMNTGAARNG